LRRAVRRRGEQADDDGDGANDLRWREKTMDRLIARMLLTATRPIELKSSPAARSDGRARGEQERKVEESQCKLVG